MDLHVAGVQLLRLLDRGKYIRRRRSRPGVAVEVLLRRRLVACGHRFPPGQVGHHVCRYKKDMRFGDCEWCSLQSMQRQAT
jgi:hypothetical protein